MYTITLSTGRKLEDLELNGNNFISREHLTADDFKDALSEVVIEGGEQREVHHDMKLIACRDDMGMTWFVLADKTPAELAQEKLLAQLNQNSSDVQDCMLAMAELFETLAN